MKLKRDFVELADREGTNFREICRRFGISAPTGYKWLRRYREEGLAGLEERSRVPTSCPGRTAAELEKQIVEARQLNPVWCGRKIKRWLENRGLVPVPSASTVTEVLRRHDLLAKPAGPSGKGWQRFERSAANELWQMDFKGWIRTRHGGRCHPLTMLDDHSRYNLLLEACGGETLSEIRPLLEQAFVIHGLPSAILCDNGPPWGTMTGNFTKLEVWLLKYGVKVYHGRPYHPQTQGKEERFHRTLKAEVLSRTTEWRDLPHCQAAFQTWREVYNHERPHDSLNGEVPASRYQVSPRPWPAKPPAPSQWYGPGDQVKKVGTKGMIALKKGLWMIGEAFGGEEVALRQIGEERFAVYYCWEKLGVMDFSALRQKGAGRYQALAERR